MMVVCRNQMKGLSGNSMNYDNITKAVFLRRPNRFIAEVDIEGHKETVHVKNTGRCKELWDLAVKSG